MNEQLLGIKQIVKEISKGIYLLQFTVGDLNQTYKIILNK